VSNLYPGLAGILLLRGLEFDHSLDFSWINTVSSFISLYSLAFYLCPPFTDSPAAEACFVCLLESSN
jgi:hypothetical protein